LKLDSSALVPLLFHAKIRSLSKRKEEEEEEEEE
jgi:hypothetical protein